MNITKSDLCTSIKKRVRSVITADDIRKIMDIMIDEIFDGLSKGHTIEIRGFGSFKTKKRSKRKGRNPKTGEEMEIPSVVVPLFKFTKEAHKTFVRCEDSETRRQKKLDRYKRKERRRLRLPKMELPATMESVVPKKPKTVGEPVDSQQVASSMPSVEPMQKMPSLSDIAEAMIKKEGAPRRGTIIIEPPKNTPEPAPTTVTEPVPEPGTLSENLIPV